MLDVCQLYEQIIANHVACHTTDGKEDVDSEGAREWRGTLEKYTLTASDGGTILTVEMNTAQDFVDMFNSCWPKALEIVKELSERS